MAECCELIVVECCCYCKGSSGGIRYACIDNGFGWRMENRRWGRG